MFYFYTQVDSFRNLYLAKAHKHTHRNRQVIDLTWISFYYLHFVYICWMSLSNDTKIISKTLRWISLLFSSIHSCFFLSLVLSLSLSTPNVELQIVSFKQIKIYHCVYGLDDSSFYYVCILYFFFAFIVIVRFCFFFFDSHLLCSFFVVAAVY